MIRKLFYILLTCTLASVVYAQQDNASKAVPETPKEKGRVVENEVFIDTTAISEELKEKEKLLNTREADLNAREARLQTLQQDILSRETDLKRMRKEVSDRLEELRGVEDLELDKLAKIYSSAKAKSAAAIFINMDINKAISVFRRMTPSVAGKILDEMGKQNPAYASKLSEGLTPQPVFKQP